MRKYLFLLFSVITFSASAQLSDYNAPPLPTDSLSKAFIGVSKRTGNVVSRFKVSPDSLYKNIYYSNGDFYGSGTQADPFKVKAKADSASTAAALAAKASQQALQDSAAALAARLGSGGGGSTSGTAFPTQQVHTTGSTVTVTSQTGDIWLIVNPASTLASLAIATPTTPVDGQKLEISFGGTITSGTVVTSLTIPGVGSPSTTISADAWETITYRYKSSNSKWYRLN